MRKVIVNTTPLIALAEIGELHLLKDLYSEIYIPDLPAVCARGIDSERLQFCAETWRRDAKARFFRGSAVQMFRYKTKVVSVIRLADNAGRSRVNPTACRQNSSVMNKILRASPSE